MGVKDLIKGLFHSQKFAPQAYAPNVSKQWTGDKYAGSFGLTKVFEQVDYWTLRKRSLQLYTENPYAKGIIKRIVRNEIHKGLTAAANPIASILMPNASDEEQTAFSLRYGDLLTKEFSVYANNYEVFDYKKQQTFGEFQETVRRESLLCGDGIVVSRINKETGLPCWEWINGNFIKNCGDWKCVAGHVVKHGVELDEAGRHIAYYVQTTKGGTVKSERIPVKGEKSGRQIAWMVYGSEKRSDEVRGEPLLACILSMLKDLDRYKDAELRAAVVNATLAFTVQKDVNASAIGTRPISGISRRADSYFNAQEPQEAGHQPISLLEPGTVMDDLAPGETVQSYDTKRPNVNYKEFEKAILDAICWSLEIPPEIARMQFDSSYSASRQANNEFNIYLNYRAWRNAKDFCQIIYEEFVIQSVLKGKIDIPNFISDVFEKRDWRKKSAYLSCSWTGLSRPSIDPLKEVSALDKALDDGLITHDEACQIFSGMSHEMIVPQLSREIDEMKKYGFNPHFLENNNGEDAYKEGSDTSEGADDDN